MLRELIVKLQQLRKKTLCTQSSTLNDSSLTESFTIEVQENEGNTKVHISDFISIVDYANRMDELGASSVADKISMNILWNSSKQKIQKGTICVIQKDNHLYNILLDEDTVVIDLRIKFEDRTEEKILSCNKKSGAYRCVSFVHDQTGSTFYNKYYNPGIKIPEAFLLSFGEVKEIIESIVMGLEDLESDFDFDLNIIKQILEDLERKQLLKK